MRKIDLAKIATNYPDPAKRIAVIETEVERVKADNLKLRASIKENDGRLTLLGDLADKARSEIESAAGRVISKLLMEAGINLSEIGSLEEVYLKVGAAVAAGKSGKSGTSDSEGGAAAGGLAENKSAPGSVEHTGLTQTSAEPAAAVGPVLVKTDGEAPIAPVDGLADKGGSVPGGDVPPSPSDISAALGGTGKRKQRFFGRG